MAKAEGASGYAGDAQGGEREHPQMTHRES